MIGSATEVITSHYINVSNQLVVCLKHYMLITSQFKTHKCNKMVIRVIKRIGLPIKIYELQVLYNSTRNQTQDYFILILDIFTPK